MRRKRPAIHFTPPKGWMNDPNGLIYMNGIYHLFYQYYPHDTKWGPMHWGHAVSEDLIHWTHKPVALTPTEESYMFSGSAILDKRNDSGLGNEENPALLLFYTTHNPKTREQMQSVAYSTDYETFAEYSGNPVICNAIGEGYKQDFRDPKIFINEQRGGYTMALAVGKAIEFYHSNMLLEWEYTGSYYPKTQQENLIIECPDCITFETPEGSKQVLTMSVVIPAEKMEDELHYMQYVVGRFDGNTFVDEDESSLQLLDYATDNYAAVSFMDAPLPTILGWGEDWNKARVNQETEYFGKMTLARTLNLSKTEEGYRMKQWPVLPKDANMPGVIIQEFHLAKGERMSPQEGICISNEGDFFRINNTSIKRFVSGVSKGICIYDRGYCEIFADDGFISYSSNIEPIQAMED